LRLHITRRLTFLAVILKDACVVVLVSDLALNAVAISGFVFCIRIVHLKDLHSMEKTSAHKIIKFK
jgi:hypothetical protein